MTVPTRLRQREILHAQLAACQMCRQQLRPGSGRRADLADHWWPRSPHRCPVGGPRLRRDALLRWG